MAILTTIGGVPLFTTVQEALSWAAGNNCTGYHTHNHQGQTGFMGCSGHLQATGLPANSNAPAQASPPQASPPQSSSSGGSGSGGGGY
tara:strand:+ start:95 stop:358 length:264 start_codon:yes stop_codon:yes gene_type:complete